MAFLTKEQLLSAQKRPTVTVPAPELGEGMALRVRLPQSAAMFRLRDLQEQAAAGRVSEAQLQVELLREALVDEESRPLFATKDEAAEAHEGMPVALMGRIADAFLQRKDAAAAPAAPETPEEGKAGPSASAG